MSIELRKAFRELAIKLEHAGNESACDEIRAILASHPPEAARAEGRERVARWFIRESLSVDSELEANAILERMWTHPGKSKADALDKADRIISALLDEGRKP